MREEVKEEAKITDTQDIRQTIQVQTQLAKFDSDLTQLAKFNSDLTRFKLAQWKIRSLKYLCSKKRHAQFHNRACRLSSVSKGRDCISCCMMLSQLTLSRPHPPIPNMAPPMGQSHVFVSMCV